MIPQAAITEWRNSVPWRSMHQVEQDLILSRALIEIYSDDALSSSLAFRGGTALHKLYLTPQARYSEDLDFVQVTPEPIGPTLDCLRNALAFLGEPRVKRKMNNNVLLFRFETTYPPITELKVKVEINCKEHFAVLKRSTLAFAVHSTWFSGSCDILSFKLEELLGSKLRALYQRKKGRDLFDLAHACDVVSFDPAKVVECYKKYIAFPDVHVPTQGEFMANLEAKIIDKQFRDDVLPMIGTGIEYKVDAAFKKIADIFIPLMSR